MLLDVVVLAGRQNTGRLASVDTATWEALINIAERPMLRWVLEALRASKYTKDIVVVGPDEVSEIAADYLASTVPPSDDLINNVEIGIAILSGNNMVACATSDIPLITASALDGFFSQCASTPAQLFYPIISKDLLEKTYPGIRRTYSTLRDGTYTGGNIVVLDPRILDSFKKTAYALIKYRKNPMMMCSVVGWGMVFKLLTGRLTISELECRASRLFGLTAKAVVLDSPEIGVDVDKPSDYLLVNEILRKSKRH